MLFAQNYPFELSALRPETATPEACVKLIQLNSLCLEGSVWEPVSQHGKEFVTAKGTSRAGGPISYNHPFQPMTKTIMGWELKHHLDVFERVWAHFEWTNAVFKMTPAQKTDLRALGL